MSWQLSINTGNPDHDRMSLEHYRKAAESQGFILQVSPLPTGGFHVRAVPPGQAAAAPPQGFGGPPPYGSPSPGLGAGAGGGAPVPGYGASPPPQQQSYGASPAAQPQQASGWGAPQAYGAPAMAMAGGGAWQAPGFAGAAMPSAGAIVGGAVQAVQSAVADLGQQRIKYLRKVYGLLALSCFLAITCGFICISVGDTVPFSVGGHKGVRVAVPMIVAAMLDNPALLYGSFGLLFLATLGASAVSKVRHLNLAALLVVSALMGVELAPMAFVAQVYAGLGDTLSANPVRDSFLLVGAIFLGITVYAFVSKKDFSYLGATLTMGFFVIFTGCILAVFIGSEVFSLAVASGGALLAAGFLLYQTSLILKGDMDDPVGDALGLLVQLRNLFMFLLRILMSNRN